MELQSVLSQVDSPRSYSISLNLQLPKPACSQRLVVLDGERVLQEEIIPENSVRNVLLIQGVDVDARLRVDRYTIREVVRPEYHDDEAKGEDLFDIEETKVRNQVFC